MKEVITTILTDAGSRDSTAVQDALQQQAVAAPWINAPSE